MSEKYALYNEFKENLKVSIEKAKISAIIHASRWRPPDYLFGIEDSQDIVYSSVIREIEKQTLLEVENLVQRLCSKYGIPCECDNFGRCDYDMVIQARGKTYKIEFKTSPYTNNAAPLARLKSDSDLIVVYLLKQTTDSYDAVSAQSQSLPGARLLLFADFIKEIFGIKEANKFNHSMENFSDEMREEIGCKITEVCSEKNLEKLKANLDKDLPQFDYESLHTDAVWTDGWVQKSRNLDNHHFIDIVQEYTTRTYKLLLGNRDFAKSFQTSEWLFRNLKIHSDLDNTFLVAGYFKSVEQLLWDILQLKEPGEKIGQYSTIGTADVESCDTVLGSMIIFIGKLHDSGFFLPSFNDSFTEVKEYIVAKLKIWTQDSRNGYFHKDNIQDSKELSNIRDETYFVLLLILGAINFSDEDIDYLMG